MYVENSPGAWTDSFNQFDSQSQIRNSEYIKDSEITADAISKIEEDLGLPLVVINGPGCYEEPSLEQQYEGISSGRSRCSSLWF